MKKKKIEFYRKRNAKHRLTDNTMISFERNEFIRKLLLGIFASGDFIGLG